MLNWNELKKSERELLGKAFLMKVTSYNLIKNEKSYNSESDEYLVKYLNWHVKDCLQLKAMHTFIHELHAKNAFKACENLDKFNRFLGK